MASWPHLGAGQELCGQSSDLIAATPGHNSMTQLSWRKMTAPQDPGCPEAVLRGAGAARGHSMHKGLVVEAQEYLSQWVEVGGSTEVYTCEATALGDICRLAQPLRMGGKAQASSQWSSGSDLISCLDLSVPGVCREPAIKTEDMGTIHACCECGPT
ncbi:hypothetical protein MC885_016034 [Smutsia gigantea]|nr:hypothetical protein MC885_016034 [Smutsia gigantea]